MKSEHPQEQHSIGLEFDEQTILQECISLPSRYLIKREIGTGGMGAVYEAFDFELRRKVAIKLILQDRLVGKSAHRINQEIIRLRDEARFAARLQHANIVAIHRFLILDDNWSEILELDEEVRFQGAPVACIVMQYVPGCQMAHLLDGGQQLSQKECELVDNTRVTLGLPHRLGETKTHESEGTHANSPKREEAVSNSNISKLSYVNQVARIGAQLAAGLAHAHAQGILHNDIKPRNIMIDSQGHAFLTDFGVATDKDSPSARIGGTKAYRAPEAQSGIQSEQSDIYSVGATLYRMVTNVRVTEDQSKADKKALISQIRSRNSLVPNGLAAVVATCLCHDLNERYHDAKTLEKELEAYLDGRPVKALPLGGWGQLVLWSKRNPVGAFFAVATLWALLIGIGLTTWQWQVAMAETTRANLEKQRAIGSIQQSLDIVQTFLVETSEGENALSGIPGTDKLRQRLLGNATNYFEAFIAQNEDLVPTSRLIDCRFFLAKTLVETGEFSQAQTEIESCLAAVEALDDNETSPKEIVERRVRYRRLLARIFALQNQYAECLGQAQLAIAMCERNDLGTGDPEAEILDIESRNIAATAQIELGDYESVEKSTKLLLERLDEFPQEARDFWYESLVASVQHNLGLAYSQLGKNDLSLQSMMASLETRSRLVDKRPNDLVLLLEIALTKHNLARKIIGTGNIAKGRLLVDEACEEFKKLTILNPHDFQTLSGFAHAKCTQAIGLIQDKHIDEALSSLDAVTAIPEGRNDWIAEGVLAVNIGRAFLTKMVIYSEQDSLKTMEACEKALEFLFYQTNQPSSSPTLLKMADHTIGVYMELGLEEECFLEVIKKTNFVVDYIHNEGQFGLLESLGEKLANRLKKSYSLEASKEVIDALSSLAATQSFAYEQTQHEKFQELAETTKRILESLK